MASVNKYVEAARAAGAEDWEAAIARTPAEKTAESERAEAEKKAAEMEAEKAAVAEEKKAEEKAEGERAETEKKAAEKAEAEGSSKDEPILISDSEDESEEGDFAPDTPVYLPASYDDQEGDSETDDQDEEERAPRRPAPSAPSLEVNAMCALVADARAKTTSQVTESMGIVTRVDVDEDHIHERILTAFEEADNTDGLDAENDMSVLERAEFAAVRALELINGTPWIKQLLETDTHASMTAAAKELATTTASVSDAYVNTSGSIRKTRVELISALEKIAVAQAFLEDIENELYSAAADEINEMNPTKRLRL
jgi:hypothetical protein